MHKGLFHMSEYQDQIRSILSRDFNIHIVALLFSCSLSHPQAMGIFHYSHLRDPQYACSKQPEVGRRGLLEHCGKTSGQNGRSLFTPSGEENKLLDLASLPYLLEFCSLGFLITSANYTHARYRLEIEKERERDRERKRERERERKREGERER